MGQKLVAVFCSEIVLVKGECRGAVALLYFCFSYVAFSAVGAHALGANFRGGIY